MWNIFKLVDYVRVETSEVHCSRGIKKERKYLILGIFQRKKRNTLPECGTLQFDQSNDGFLGRLMKFVHRREVKYREVQCIILTRKRWSGAKELIKWLLFIHFFCTSLLYT